MDKTGYSISEAAHLVDIQSHVLRYWEEEMLLPIARNEMGHRYYTQQDIQIFLSIKELKKKGLSLRKIKLIIPQLYGTPETVSRKEPLEVPEEIPVITPATIDPADKPIVEEPLVEPFTPTVPLSAPDHEDKEMERVSKKTRFEQIMDRLIREVSGDRRKMEKERQYQNLDEKIRSHQLTRKMIAATKENTKKRFGRKK